MNISKDIIQRCHQRREKSLQQRKTVITPALYKGVPYHFTVYCAHRYPVKLYELEQADVSFMPIGHAPVYESGPTDFGGERFLTRQGIEDWGIRQWYRSWGIQVYTGIPSARDGARWHDLNFTYEAVCAAPDAVSVCIETLVNIVANPLLTITKSGGLRFSCRVRDYLHPNTEAARQYIYKHTPTPENSYQQEVYLEIFGDKGFSRWDGRYEILLGNLLDPPVIAKEVLFTPIDALRDMLHQPLMLGKKGLQSVVSDHPVAPASLGSHNLDLAKQALTKRGFSYIKQENGSYYWQPPADSVRDERHVSLWEREGTVWIRASTSDLGIPMEATLITELWDDTGILPQTPNVDAFLSDTLLAVRAGKLSPLAIKRPSTVLQKPEGVRKDYEPLENNAAQIQGVFDGSARVLALIAEKGGGKSYGAETYVLNGSAISLNAKHRTAKAAKRFEKRDISSVVRYRSRKYLWDRVKDIPVDVRMANPFEHGNMCEDPERCDALAQKGGNPRESICPECPVYTACQQRGYLSQPAALQGAKVQISGQPRIFLDPLHSETVENLLGQDDETERLCIFDNVQSHQLFSKCSLSKHILEAWSVSWQGHALGHFSKALLNAVENIGAPDENAVRRIRTTMHAFERQADALIQQMCQVNVDGHVPMSMDQAIKLGILDASSVESIQGFPDVCSDPHWTFWHRLQRFFAYYKRDADTPMIWYNNALNFWVPPVLHPRVKRLLLMSSSATERDVRKAFPHTAIEVTRLKPTAWVAGNKVFQMRTDPYPCETLLENYHNWNVLGVSKTGQRIFSGIRAEIERDSSVKHAIVTYMPIVKQLKDISEIENVCFVTHFKDLNGFPSAFEEAQVVWIVGTPQWAPGIIWRRSQILYGNDESPLSYETETEPYRYKDERVQCVYEQHTVKHLSEIVGHIGLNRLSGKTVVLVTSVALPDITDRPETLLFDWEDFEVAGGLDKLSEAIAIRERFEIESANITADTHRTEVERILGCSPRQAYRVLHKLRGGNIPRVLFREQIFSLLANGERKASELVEAIEGHPTSVRNELTRLVDAGEIVKVGWGVYTLPPSTSSK